MTRSLRGGGAAEVPRIRIINKKSKFVLAIWREIWYNTRHLSFKKV